MKSINFSIDAYLSPLLLLYVALVILNLMILPPISMISVDNVLLPLVILAVSWKYRKSRLFWWSILPIFFLIGSGLLSNYFNGGISIKEALWSIRWIKILFLCWSAYYLFSEFPKLIERMLVIAFLFMVLINALQLIHWDFIINLYSPKESMSDYLHKSLLDARTYGVMINPNNNGLVMALFGIYFFSSKIKYKYLLMILASMLMIMAQSRTAFVAFVGVLVISMGVHYFRNNRRGLLLLLGGSAFGYLLLIQLKFTNLSSLLTGAAFKSNSLLTRFEVLDKTWDVNRSSFWFGKGKIMNIPEYLGYSIDNEYAFVYLEYGFVGIVALASLILLLIFLSVSNRYRIGNLGLIMVMLICGLTNLSFTNLEIAPIFFILFAGTSTFFAYSKNPENEIQQQAT